MKDAQGREVQWCYDGNIFVVSREQYAGSRYWDRLGVACSALDADEKVRRVVAGEPLISDRELFDMGMAHRNDRTPFRRDKSGDRVFDR